MTTCWCKESSGVCRGEAAFFFDPSPHPPSFFSSSFFLLRLTHFLELHPFASLISPEASGRFSGGVRPSLAPVVSSPVLLPLGSQKSLLCLCMFFTIPTSVAAAYLRMKIGFLLTRASTLCLRGTHKKKDPTEMERLMAWSCKRRGTDKEKPMKKRVDLGVIEDAVCASRVRTQPEQPELKG